MDYDLFYRMWRIGRFRKTTEFLGCIRQHDETKSARSADIWRRELAEAKQLYALRDPGYISARLLNRTDRLQVSIEDVLTRRNKGKKKR